VSTVKIRGGTRVASVIRLYLTGVQNVTKDLFEIRIGGERIPGSVVLTGGTLVDPGVYTVDFPLPPGLRGVGDQPVIVTVRTQDGVIYSSRLDDSTSFLNFL